MSDSINKVTIYKVKEIEDFDIISFSGYTVVAGGNVSERETQFKYKLFFLNRFIKTPQWFGVFSTLDIPEERIPVAQTSGFIMVVQLLESYYAFTGGIGHIRLREVLAIEPRFGVILAEKILSLPELKRLTQKDTSGVVNFLDRAFRSKYNPEGDVSNLRRILTNMGGKLSEHNRHYATIGKSIQAGNALTVTGSKTFDQLLSFLIEVDSLWHTGERIIRIPQLQCIGKRFEPDLFNRLEEKLIEDVCSPPTDDDSLFLDNEDMGYLPDRISKYQIKLGRQGRECDTYSDVFFAAGEMLNQTNSMTEKMKIFRRLRLILTFDDDITQQKDLFYFICGDVILDNEYYFINNKLWYKANDEYISKLNSEIDNIPFIKPEDLQLNEWDDTQYSGPNGEFRYNQSNSLHICLDGKLVSIDNERGGIEFCDLLSGSNGSVRLIHVKKSCGAALRALFAQGFVSSQLYALDSQFQTKIHGSDLRRVGVELTNDNKQFLANLNTKYRNQFNVIYAIYDNKASHHIHPNPQKTSDWLNGTLTTFAKVDLLNRASSLRAMGYNVAVTRIKPYPI